MDDLDMDDLLNEPDGFDLATDDEDPLHPVTPNMDVDRPAPAPAQHPKFDSFVGKKLAPQPKPAPKTTVPVAGRPAHTGGASNVEAIPLTENQGGTMSGPARQNPPPPIPKPPVGQAKNDLIARHAPPPPPPAPKIPPVPQQTPAKVPVPPVPKGSAKNKILAKAGHNLTPPPVPPSVAEKDAVPPVQRAPKPTPAAPSAKQPAASPPPAAGAKVSRNGALQRAIQSKTLHTLNVGGKKIQTLGAGQGVTPDDHAEAADFHRAKARKLMADPKNKEIAALHMQAAHHQDLHASGMGADSPHKASGKVPRYSAAKDSKEYALLNDPKHGLRARMSEMRSQPSHPLNDANPLKQKMQRVPGQKIRTIDDPSMTADDHAAMAKAHTLHAEALRLGKHPVDAAHQAANDEIAQQHMAKAMEHSQKAADKRSLVPTPTPTPQPRSPAAEAPPAQPQPTPAAPAPAQPQAAATPQAAPKAEIIPPAAQPQEQPKAEAPAQEPAPAQAAPTSQPAPQAATPAATQAGAPSPAAAPQHWRQATYDLKGRNHHDTLQQELEPQVLADLMKGAEAAKASGKSPEEFAESVEVQKGANEPKIRKFLHDWYEQHQPGGGQAAPQAAPEAAPAAPEPQATLPEPTKPIQKSGPEAARKVRQAAAESEKKAPSQGAAKIAADPEAAEQKKVLKGARKIKEAAKQPIRQELLQKKAKAAKKQKAAAAPAQPAPAETASKAETAATVEAAKEVAAEAPKGKPGSAQVLRAGPDTDEGSEAEREVKKNRKMEASMETFKGNFYDWAEKHLGLQPGDPVPNEKQLLKTWSAVKNRKKPTTLSTEDDGWETLEEVSEKAVAELVESLSEGTASTAIGSLDSWCEIWGRRLADYAIGDWGRAIQDSVAGMFDEEKIPGGGYDHWVGIDETFRAKAHLFASDRVNVVREKVKEVIAKSIRDGDSVKAFRKAVKGCLKDCCLTSSEAETLFRTNRARAASEALDKMLAKPEVGKHFPYREYFATHDDRVRPEHIAMEKHGIGGTGVYRADDPVWALYKPPEGFNCRCTYTALTVKAAAAKGIAEAKEWLKTGQEPKERAWVEMPKFGKAEADMGFDDVMDILGGDL